MTGNTFGRMFRVTTCGESYSGCFRKTPDIPKELYGGLLTIVDGCPPGVRITAEDIQQELDKRKPGGFPAQGEGQGVYLLRRHGESAVHRRAHRHRDPQQRY